MPFKLDIGGKIKSTTLRNKEKDILEKYKQGSKDYKDGFEDGVKLYRIQNRK